jgi:hypothetical protein
LQFGLAMVASSLKQTLLSLWLTLSFLAGSSAFAQAPLCSSVFLNTAKKSFTVESLDPLISEFFQQREAGTPIEKVVLKIEGPLKEDLEWMRAQILSITALDVATMPGYERSLLYAYVLKTKEQFKAIPQQKSILYTDYLQLTKIFSVAITAKASQHMDAAQITLLRAELLNETNNTLASAIETQAPDKKNFFFLPMRISLGVRSMNALQARDVSVLGITNKIEVVDNVAYAPFDFFNHDFVHGLFYELQPKFIFKEGRMVMGVKLPILARGERTKFYETFEKSLADSTLSARAKKIREHLWFLVFHEDAIPMHPENLKLQLMPLRVESSLKRVVERLNNPRDLGYAFRDQAVTAAELVTEVEALIQFTSNL